MAKAKAEGLKSLLSVGDVELLKFYLACDNKLFESLADKTAAAIQGLNPSIHVWNTGAAGGDGTSSDPYAAVRNLFTSLPPMLDAVQNQTAVKLPNWMPHNASQA